MATTTSLVGGLPLDLNLRVQLSQKKPQPPKPAKRAHRRKRFQPAKLTA